MPSDVLRRLQLPLAGEHGAYYVAFSPAQSNSAISNRGTFDRRDRSIPASVERSGDARIFYSQAYRIIEQKAPNKGSGAQMLAIVTNPQSGVKKEELDWLGLREWLSDQRSVTKQEILDFARANQAQVQEIVKGGAETWRTYDWNRLEEGDFVRIPFDQGIKEILVIRNKEGDGESVSYSLVESDNRGNDWPVEAGDNLSLMGLRRKLEKINDEALFDDGLIKDSIYNPIRPISRNETDDTNAALRAFERGEPVYFVSNRDGEAIRIWDERTFTSRESLRRDEVDAGRAVWRIGSPDAEGVTKYDAYTLPGGKQYRELLITMPDIRRERSLEPITELPEDYRVSVDPLAAPNARYCILPPGQEHARPFYGVHPSREAAIASAVEFINYQRREEWERGRPSFKSSHWDEPNVLVHVRFNDRVDTGGKRTLFIEEVQSDFAQEGRRKGFKGRLPEGWKIEEEQRGGRTAYVVVDERGRAQESSFDRRTAINEATRQGVPDMPFRSTESWASLAVKRVLRWAVENGYDRVAWTTGETQAERYGFSKEIDRLKVLEGRYSEVRGTQGYEVTAWKDGREVIDKRIPRDELPDLIGKEMAEKAVAQIAANKQRPVPKYSAEFAGLDLKVGGEGMKRFYDRMLVSFVNRYVKKWGAKVEQEAIPLGSYGFDVKESGSGLWNVFDYASDVVHRATTEEQAKAWVKRQGRAEEAVHSVTITDKMRESVMLGQPLYERERQTAGREIPGSSPSLREHEGEGRRPIESPAGEVLGVESTGRGGRVAWTQADIENSPPTFYSVVERAIERRLPFIEEALAAGASLDHISIQHHGTNWTIVSFENAKGTYLLNGEDVYVTQASVRQAQFSIEADPVSLPGISDLELAGDIEIEAPEIRSEENRVEPRGRSLDYTLSL